MLRIQGMHYAPQTFCGSMTLKGEEVYALAHNLDLEHLVSTQVKQQY